MRTKRSERRSLQKNASFKLSGAETSGKIVAELTDITHSFDEQLIISEFSTTVLRGDRIGIVGANGAGKSTLLKILLGKLQPGQGKVKLGTKLEVAYFDQLREHLDLEKNLIENVCDGQDFVEIDGQKKHAISYLSDFLFTPDRIRTPAKALSGGEQNRAILAKVFSKSANVLVLDEPTNDLDIETLELLEDILLKFKGTVLLVSHDRQFMDNVVTSLMVFEGQGAINEYVGGYSNWTEKGGKLVNFENNEIKTATNTSPEIKGPAIGQGTKKAQKISYKDQQELSKLPARIEKLESEQSDLESLISASNFYNNDKDKIQQTLQRLTNIQSQLEQIYQRWEELEKSK